MNSLFKLRGELTRSQSILYTFLGFIVLIIFWWLLAELFSEKVPVLEGYNQSLPSSIGDDVDLVTLDSIARADSILFANATEFKKVYKILPTPLAVVKSYPSLITKDELVPNAIRSIWINLQGYFWAILISIPIGFVIGLIPLFRGLFGRQVDAMRFLPLTALTGLFILWFGIDDPMKVAFLAFGIIVYLLPVVVQRIWEVNDVYLKTVFTLGASDWQTVKTVYIPSVMSVIFDDIRVLTAISWTYIIIAEVLNRAGGIGSLIFIKARQGQLEKVFAILVIIILIGVIQDWIFVFLGRRLFPHKHFKSMVNGIKEAKFGIYFLLGGMLLAVMLTGILGMSNFVLVAIAVVVLSSLLFTGYGETIIRKNTVGHE